jgi:hypothetical protein
MAARIPSYFRTFRAGLASRRSKTKYTVLSIGLITAVGILLGVLSLLRNVGAKEPASTPMVVSAPEGGQRESDPIEVTSSGRSLVNSSTSISDNEAHGDQAEQTAAPTSLPTTSTAKSTTTTTTTPAPAAVTPSSSLPSSLAPPVQTMPPAATAPPTDPPTEFFTMYGSYPFALSTEAADPLTLAKRFAWDIGSVRTCSSGTFPACALSAWGRIDPWNDVSSYYQVFDMVFSKYEAHGAVVTHNRPAVAPIDQGAWASFYQFEMEGQVFYVSVGGSRPGCPAGALCTGYVARPA